jgi:hypothetical protein
MLRFLTRFSTRCFLSIAVIFVFIVVDSFLRFSASFPPREVVFYPSRDGLIDSHCSFQPCLTCFQLPSVVVFALVAPTELLARTPPRGVRPLHTRRLMLNYSPLLVLVVSGAALVAGLPEATAAGKWARGVHYSALLFWLFLVVMLWVYFATTLLS